MQLQAHRAWMWHLGFCFILKIPEQVAAKKLLHQCEILKVKPCLFIAEVCRYFLRKLVTTKDSTENAHAGFWYN